VTYSFSTIGASRLGYWQATSPTSAPVRSEHRRADRLLLLHGLGADHRGLLPLTGGWPDIEIIAPDLPGFGMSPPMRVEHSLINYGHALEVLCAQTDLTDLTVIGHSLGAGIGLAFAATHPRRIRALVLLNPVTSGHGPMTWLTRAYYRAGSLLPTAAARAWFASKPAVYLADMAALRTHDPDTRQRILAEDYRTAALSNPQVITQIYHSMRSTPFPSLAAAITAPTLLITAEHDTLATPHAVTDLHHQIPGSDLQVINGAGHLWAAEEPETAGHIIATWLHGRPHRPLPS
jgi:pimeloyl-ACP methyl ester carboxylesterase